MTWVILAVAGVALFYIGRALWPHLAAENDEVYASMSGAYRIAPGGAVLKENLSLVVRKLATAIAKFETGWRGFGDFPLNPTLWQGRAQINNNPGNLRYGFQARALGVDEGNYTRFRTPQDGWSALLSDVRAKLIGETRTKLGPHSTIAEFITVWAPPHENPTAAYINFVSSELGVSAYKPFKEWIDYA